MASLRAGRTGYSATAGTPELREAAARDLSVRRGIEVGADEVLIGNGAKPFLLFTVLALCEPGDEVIVPDPGFPIYESAIRFAGATPAPLPVAEAGGFGLDLEALERALGPRTKLVILNFPHNPTGGAAGREELDAAAALIAESPAWVLSDEVYSRYLYDGEFASIASAPGMLDRTVLLDGLSKGHAMTGWRCGFAAVPEPLREAIARFFVNSTSCVPPFVQDGAVAALDGPQGQVEAMVAEFRARRDLLVAGLNAIDGVRCQVRAAPSTPSPTSPPPGCRAMSWPGDYSRTPASRSSTAPPSGPAGATTCASPTPARAPPSSSRWSGSPGTSAASPKVRTR